MFNECILLLSVKAEMVAQSLNVAIKRTYALKKFRVIEQVPIFRKRIRIL